MDTNVLLSAVLFGGRPGELVEQLVLEMASFMDVFQVEPSRETWASDPADDPVVETALQGRATVVVTGDRGLPKAVARGTMFLTVGEMLERIQARR